MSFVSYDDIDSAAPQAQETNEEVLEQQIHIPSLITIVGPLMKVCCCFHNPLVVYKWITDANSTVTVDSNTV